MQRTGEEYIHAFLKVGNEHWAIIKRLLGKLKRDKTIIRAAPTATGGVWGSQL